MTLTQIRNLVKANVQTDGHYADADIDLFINDAMRQYVDNVKRSRKRARPGGTGTINNVATLVTVAGKQEYFAGTDWLVTELYDIVQIVVNGVPLKKISLDDALQMDYAERGYPLVAGSTSTPAQGQPAYYYTRDTDETGGLIVGFWRVPDGVYDIDLTWEAEPADMAAGDSPLKKANIPARFHRGLMHHALWNILQNDRRYADAEYHRQMWDSFINAARMSQQATEPSYFHSTVSEGA